MDNSKQASEEGGMDTNSNNGRSLRTQESSPKEPHIPTITTTPPTLATLPPELHLLILTHLDPITATCLALTSHHFYTFHTPPIALNAFYTPDDGETMYSLRSLVDELRPEGMWYCPFGETNKWVGKETYESEMRSGHPARKRVRGKEGWDAYRPWVEKRWGWEGEGEGENEQPKGEGAVAGELGERADVGAEERSEGGERGLRARRETLDEELRRRGSAMSYWENFQWFNDGYGVAITRDGI